MNFEYEKKLNEEKKITLPLQHKGWKMINIPKVINYQDKKSKLPPRKIATIFINSSTENAEFAIGALKWEKNGVRLEKLDVGNTASIYKISQPPVIDGDINDSVWGGVDEMPLQYLAHNHPGKPLNNNWIKATYDDTNFYLAGSFSFKKGTKLKADLKENDAALWEDEDFEFFLYPDSDPRMYYQFMINPIGTKSDLAVIFDQIEDRIVLKYKNWNGKWEGKAKIYDDRWTIEASIPWSTIGSANIPELIQFQTMRCDRTVTPNQYPVWSPVIRRAVEGFGMLNPSPIKSSTVKIGNLLLKRTDEDKVNLSCTIESDKAIGDVEFKSWYSDPYSATKKFSKNISINGNAGTIEQELNIGNAVNGFHQTAFKVIPENKSLTSSCAIYDFVQTLPGKFKFDDVVFNPIPKKVKWNDGKFILKNDDIISVPEEATDRTVKTAEYLANKLYGLYGIKPKVVKGGKGRISLNLNTDKVKSKTGTDWHEGYLLDITPEMITITGAGKAGLYYGVITLMQLASAPKQPNQPIKAVSIIDWPSYNKRISAIYMMFHNKKDIGDGKGGINIQKMKDWMERHLAGSKYNMVGLTWANQVNYPSLPEIHHQRNFSPKEVRELADFAREHFLEVVPGLLYGAHCPSFTRHYPEIIEKKFGASQMDVTHPKVYEIMGKLYNDLIDMAGKPVRYFNTFNDEWWHKAKTKEDVIYKGKTRQEIFHHFLMEEYKRIKKHNLKMMMFTDMLLPTHNGRPPFNLAEVAKQLPRDIAMASWSGSNEYFDKLGYKDLWYIGNGFTADFRKPYRNNTGFGQINYNGNTLFNQTDQWRTLNYCCLTEYQVGNYGWNKDVKGVLPTLEWTMQYMPSLMGVYSMEPNPDAGNKLTPVDITSDDSKINELFQKSEDTIGGIPMKLGAVKVTPGNNMIIDFKPDTKISSLYILNNVAPEDKAAVKKLHQRYRKVLSARPYGIIVGKYILNYTDGTKVEKSIRLGRSIALLEYTPAQSRYVKKCRAVYPLKSDFSIALNQFEWVNPHPDKTVQSFEVSSEYSFAPIIFCGLTIRDTKNKK